MSHQRLPPPEPEDCLIRSRVSTYKGGTLIAEDVRDLDAHVRRLADGDAYRPCRCPRCRGDALHVHDYPERKPRGETGVVVRIVRYICASAECAATWRILPAFLARHLWFSWRAVEKETREAAAPEPVSPPKGARQPVPRKTGRRWRARLASTAKQLVLLLSTSGGALLEALAKGVGLDAPRRDLVEAHAALAETPIGRRLADLAALVHRLERGIRLM